MRRLKSTVSTSILSGWKEIANHLGKGVRTVQRYELELALPVRRVRESFALRRQQPDNAAALADFKTVLTEHHRLREEMAIFRREMHTAMQELRQSVMGLRTQHTTHRSGLLMLPDGGEQRPN